LVPLLFHLGHSIVPFGTIGTPIVPFGTLLYPYCSIWDIQLYLLEQLVTRRKAEMIWFEQVRGNCSGTVEWDNRIVPFGTIGKAGLSPGRIPSIEIEVVSPLYRISKKLLLR
jgi:hypothetical protein